ncbi:MAG: WbuC family cupin fold metalloprotein [bacterium]|nr:WbuC family cupin fold metalloprotein [bacterium]
MDSENPAHRHQASRSAHQHVAFVDDDLLDARIAASRSNSRGRAMYAFHAHDGEILQRMINALQVGSYVRPHRHLDPPKAESIIVLRGSLAFIAFHDDGTLDTDNSAVLSSTESPVGADWRAGVWHTCFALEPDTLIFEVKEGPYDPNTDKDFAPWAPEEGTTEAGEYLEQLMVKARALR